MPQSDLKILLKADDRATKELQKVKGALVSLGSVAGKVGPAVMLGATVAAAGLAALGIASIKAAMDAVESENLFDVSMGNMAEAARKWSEQVRDQLGMNSYEVRKTVGTFNVMLNSMGLAEDASYGMAKGLTQLSYDMASFYNLRPEEAFTKLQAAISGESEPLKRLGIIVNETTIKQWALTQGLIEQGQELSEAGKVAARYGVIMEQTSKAQGDMARTMESPANLLRIIKSRFSEISIEVGRIFLPVVSDVLNWIAKEGLPMVERGVEKFKEVWPKITEAMHYVWVGAKGVIDGLKEGWGTARRVTTLAWLYIRDFIASTWNKIADSTETTINGIIKGLNFVIRGMNLLKPGEDIASIAEISIRQLDRVSEAEFALAKVIGYVADETDTTIDVFEESAEALNKGAMTAEELTASAYAAIPALDGMTAAADNQSDSVKELTRDYDGYIDSLVTTHPAVHKLNQEYAVLEAELITQQSALRGNQYAIRDAQEEYSRMQAGVAYLNQELSEMRQRLQELSAPKLVGMKAIEDQIFAVEQQIKRVKLAELLGQPFEEMFKDTGIGMPRTVDALQRMLEVLELQKGLKYDEDLKKIKEAAEGVPEEMTYDEAIKGIEETKARIDYLSNAIIYENQKLDEQAGYIKNLQWASEQLNETIAQTQKRMTETEKTIDKVTDALILVLGWILKDKDAFIEMGGTAEQQALTVDNVVRNLWGVLQGFISDSSNQSIAAMDALVSHYEASIAAMAAGFPTYNWPMPMAETEGLQHGGRVTKTGLAVVHKGEEFSGIGNRIGGVTVNFVYSPTVSTASEGEMREAANVLTKLLREEGRRTTWRVP